MKKEVCPPESALAAFVRCQVSGDQADSISDHISHCPRCEETVVGLERETNTVVEKLKRFPAAFPFQHEPELERMAQAAKQHAPLPGDSTEVEPLSGGKPEYLRDYQIIEKIGEGGMGAVYKAVHVRLKKTVALKILATNRIGDEPAVARFEREMSVIGQLNHPHIVQALDAGEHDGKHYLVMEYVEGQDLSMVVHRRAPLSIPDACQLAYEAAIGLQCAHEHGFVHRDIKPSNLMLAAPSSRAVTPTAVVKILDLGLARALDQPTATGVTKAELTTTGQVMGTLDYMAPEQGGDAHQVDIRADIYSLGATLYKLLTSDSPYAEHAQKPPLQRLLAIAQHEPPLIRTKRSEIPEQLAAIVHRMMAKQPEKRFATPAEVAAALEPFCVGANLSALLAPQDGTRPAKPNPQAFSSSQQTRSNGFFTRRWRLAVAGVAGFMALAAILLITTSRGTVEVTSPDGKLPNDVKVVVSRGGEEVEILQADNHWTAKIVHGEYQIQLRGGDDRFEVRDSRLTISRLGRVAVTVNLRPLDAKPENAAVVATPAVVKPPATPTTPALPLADQDKPFVVLNRDSQTIGAYKFITEVLPILAADEVLEVRGNGPFNVPQITRDKVSLRIRAGQGYRPRFRADFPTPDDRQNNWFQLNEVACTIEGCDFVGTPANHFFLFAGTGEWLFQDCRLIGLPTHTGGLLGFSGSKLVVRDSFLTCLSAYYAMSFGPQVQVEFSNNIVCNSSTAFGFQFGDEASLTLKSNLFHRTTLLGLPEAKGKERLRIVAEDNLFIPPSTAICFAHSASAARKLLDWRGAGNRVIQSQPGALFEAAIDKDPAAPLPTTVDEWNKYWGSDSDLRAAPPRDFDWDFLAAENWTAGVTKFEEELAAARKKFPELTPLGPDMRLVGARPASSSPEPSSHKEPSASRPEALEGGPFVIIRKGQPVAGFISLAKALEQTRSGDLIEVRSDGVIRTGRLASPPNQSLTLAAGPGYSPVFAQLWLSGGDWTLQGLRLRPEMVEDAPACAVRQVVHCTMEVGGAYTNLALFAPDGREDPVEILNCYLAQGVYFSGRRITIHNSVLRSVALAKEASVTATKTCFWNHSTATRSPTACIGQAGSKMTDVHLTDCLVDTEFLLSSPAAKWRGERNLLRIHGANWGTIANPGQPVRVYRSLAEWRDAWKSDADSQFDDSVLLRPDLWRSRAE